MALSTPLVDSEKVVADKQSTPDKTTAGENEGCKRKCCMARKCATMTGIQKAGCAVSMLVLSPLFILLSPLFLLKCAIRRFIYKKRCVRRCDTNTTEDGGAATEKEEPEKIDRA